MRNNNKNIDPAEAARRKAEYEAKYITHTQPTYTPPTTKLEPEPEPETGIFSSMNEVSEGDSNFFRNIVLTVLTLIIAGLGKGCYEYMKRL
jgi:hypothetical protein